MKAASLTGNLLMMKGRAAPSLSNKQTQEYEDSKSSMFASLTTGTGVDEESEIFVAPEVDEDYLHIPEKVLMSAAEIEAPIDSIIPDIDSFIPDEAEEVTPEAPEEAEEVKAKPSKSGPRVSTSLRLSEERHLQLRLLAARQKRSIQAVLKDMVHEHLEADMKGMPCICKPDNAANK